MSDEETIREIEAEEGDLEIEGDGTIMLVLPKLPDGSLITLTIRVGPEPVAAPEPAPAPVKRYVGGV